MRLLHFNPRSLFQKRSQLEDISRQVQPDVIAVTETWPWMDSVIPVGAILPSGFVVAYRADRVDCVGGDVIILCRDYLKFVQRRDLCCWKESAWIELKSFSSRSLLVGCYYRPLRQSTADV